MKEILEIPQQDAGSVQIPKPNPIVDAEWCFQFFDNEPVIFGWQDEGIEPTPLTFKIEAAEGEGLTFKQNGMQFKIFPRPISEETKIQRQKEKQK